MADFNFVTERIATGAAITGPADVQALVAAGITHVIDCAQELMASDGQLLSAEPHFTYLPNGTADDGQPKPPEWFGPGIVFALEALSRPYAIVYAHCAAGRNRGPSMTSAIMMAMGWTKAQAEAQIRAVRPQVGLTYLNDAAAAVKKLGYGDPG